MLRAACAVALVIAASGGSRAVGAGSRAGAPSQRTCRAHTAVLRSLHQHHLHRNRPSSRNCDSTSRRTGKPRNDRVRVERVARSRREGRAEFPRRSDAPVRQRASRREKPASRDAPIRRPDRRSRWRFCSRTISSGTGSPFQPKELAARPARVRSTSSSRLPSACA